MAYTVALACAFAFLQTITAQCIGSPFNSAFGLAANGFNGLGTNGFAGNGLGANGFAGNGLAANGFATNALAGNAFANNALAANGLAGFNGPYGAGCGAGVASTGGGLPVTSGSPIAPTGVSVVSENAYEGPLAVGGNLPFLGTVALEGTVPTAGAGAVSYGCGDGAIGITSEAPIATGIVGPGTYPPAGPVGPAGAAGLAGPAGLSGLGYNGLGGLGLNGLGRFGLGAGNCAL